MWRPYGWSGANHMKYHMHATWVPIWNPYRFHMTLLLGSLKLWSLEHRRVRADLIEVFKMFQGLSIVDINTFFSSLTVLVVQEVIVWSWRKGVSTDLRQHFFSERIVNIWNRLEPSIVESSSLNIFKSKLQSLHDKDESFFGQYLSYWLQRPSQPPWGGLIWWVLVSSIHTLATTLTLILTLSVTLSLTLNPTVTVNLTLISSYLTNKHQYPQPISPPTQPNWMTSRLRDQSAASCKNCRPVPIGCTDNTRICQYAPYWQ